MSNINSRFSTVLKSLRKEKGLTQEGLAELSGIDYKYLQKLESSKPSSPTLETLEKLGKGLKVSIADIVQRLEIPVD